MKFSRKHLLILIFGFLALSNIFIFTALFRQAPSKYLKVVFLNIGQGDAIYIETPHHRQILIDGGPGSVVLSELGRVMPFYDHSIDMIIETHPDMDHIGGLPPVLDRFKVSAMLLPGVSASTSVVRELESDVVKEGALHVFARRGMTLHLDENINLEILFPDRDVSGLETNNASIVAKLVYGETSFMLTGDSPQIIEDYLSALDDENPEDELKSDVLKVGHHGSRTSSGDIFLQHVHPTYAVISDGKDNKYGHPHYETLDRLRNVGALIHRTDEEGRITFLSDGKNVKLK